MGRWKTVIGSTLKARHFGSLRIEAKTGTRVSSQMTELGRPEFSSVARKISWLERFSNNVESAQKDHGDAPLLGNGPIETTFAYDNGDEAILKAKSETSSTPCSN
jgi:hypothetical protein